MYNYLLSFLVLFSISLTGSSNESIEILFADGGDESVESSPGNLSYSDTYDEDMDDPLTTMNACCQNGACNQMTTSNGTGITTSGTYDIPMLGSMYIHCYSESCTWEYTNSSGGTSCDVNDKMMIMMVLMILLIVTQMMPGMRLLLQIQVVIANV
tara:strand:- start:48 stop:512 length:465 start_codon:yes stop_codon:yes gene_type:complete